MDSTAAMNFEDREGLTAQLVGAWIAKWLGSVPDGEDEPSRNSMSVTSRGSRQADPSGPQQLPDSRGYDDLHESQTKTVYPTDAKAREKERRKAQKASGKAHIVKKRNIAVEEHYDDRGEDLSALQGTDLCSMAWTDTLMEEAEPGTAENAHHLECDGLSSFML
jgi:hypothetical protein